VILVISTYIAYHTILSKNTTYLLVKAKKQPVLYICTGCNKRFIRGVK